MFSAKINPFLSLSTFFLVSILLSFLVTTKSDNPCAYPCYPPPTGTGGTTTPTTPVTTPPSPPSTQTGFNPPPPAVYNNPTGYYPYNPPPSTYNGYGSNPPPDPILPYFPFYYKNGAHGDRGTSSATPLIRRPSTFMINSVATTNFLIVFFCCFFL